MLFASCTEFSSESLRTNQPPTRANDALVGGFCLSSAIQNWWICGRIPHEIGSDVVQTSQPTRAALETR